MKYAFAAALAFVALGPATTYAGCGDIADVVARSACYSKPAPPEEADPASAPDEMPDQGKRRLIGDKVTLSDASIGCADLDDLSKIKNLVAVMKDEVAALRAARRAGCPTKLAGTPGTVQGHVFMARRTLRPLLRRAGLLVDAKAGLQLGEIGMLTASQYGYSVGSSRRDRIRAKRERRLAGAPSVEPGNGWFFVTMSALMILAILFTGGIAAYFIPIFIGFCRGRPMTAIVILNVFLGWTVIGWVVAFALSFGQD